jgi:hypothetical protein
VTKRKTPALLTGVRMDETWDCRNRVRMQPQLPLHRCWSMSSLTPHHEGQQNGMEWPVDSLARGRSKGCKQLTREREVQMQKHCSERPSRCFAQRKGLHLEILKAQGYSDPAAHAKMLYPPMETVNRAAASFAASGTVRLTESNEMRHGILKLDQIIGMGVGERHSCRADINSALA